MATKKNNKKFGASYRIIDVSDRPVESEVLRNGYKVPAIELDQDRVANIIADEFLDRLTIQPRVVYQSIPSGTRVPRGTTVDIVLTSPFLIGVDVLPGAHVDLVADNMGNVADIYLADIEVRNAIGMASTYDELPPAVRTQLETAARDNNVTLAEDTPGQDTQSLFHVLQAANTYS